MNVAVFRFINGTMKNPFLDQVLPAFSDKDYVVIPGFVVLVLLVYFGRRRVRTCVLALVCALAFSDALTEHALKNIFNEKRPYAVLENVHVHRGGKWVLYDPAWYAFDKRQSNAFPSSHAANIAAVAAVLFFLHRRTLWGTVPLALAVGLSRVYTGNHYPLDVLAGYFWGGACGFAMFKAVSVVVERLRGKASEESLFAAASPERKKFLWLLAGWTLFNFVFVHLNLFDLAGDEAQYWDWSRRLELGYYSKPPMVAYVNAILEGAGGSAPWAIRSGAILFTSGMLALVYGLTLRIAKSERAALLAAIALMATPLIWAGSVILTVDPILAFFWVLAMYAFHRAVNEGGWPWWLTTGAALGLGTLSKYTMLLLGVSFALYLLLVDRKWLLTRKPYCAVLIALLLMSGVIYWNYSNDWVSIKHTASIGARGVPSPGKSIKYFGDFLGGQLGVVSPILFGLFIWAMVRMARRFRAERDAAYLFLCFIVLFGFYGVLAFTRKSLPNWPACSYLATAPALGLTWYGVPRGKKMRNLLVAGVVLGCALGLGARSSGVLYWATAPFVKEGDRPDRIHLSGFEISPSKDPTNKLIGGRELGEAVSKYVGSGKDTGPFLFSDRYQITAWLAFYTKGHPFVHCLDTGMRRMNQYDIWANPEKYIGRDGIFVTGSGEERAQRYIAAMVGLGAFDDGKCLETVNVWRGKTLVRTFTISRLSHFRGRVSKGASEEVQY